MRTDARTNPTSDIESRCGEPVVYRQCSARKGSGGWLIGRSRAWIAWDTRGWCVAWDATGRDATAKGSTGKGSTGIHSKAMHSQLGSGDAWPSNLHSLMDIFGQRTRCFEHRRIDRKEEQPKKGNRSGHVEAGKGSESATSVNYARSGSRLPIVDKTT